MQEHLGAQVQFVVERQGGRTQGQVPPAFPRSSSLGGEPPAVHAPMTALEPAGIASAGLRGTSAAPHGFDARGADDDDRPVAELLRDAMPAPQPAPAPAAPSGPAGGADSLLDA